MFNKDLGNIKAHINKEFKSLIERTYDENKNRFWVLNIEPNQNWIGSKSDTIIAYFWNTQNSHVFIINDLNSTELSTLLKAYNLPLANYDVSTSIHTVYFKGVRAKIINEVEQEIKY